MSNHKYQFVETRDKFFWFPCRVLDRATNRTNWRWLSTRTVAVYTSESECLEAPGLLSYAYFENYTGPTHEEQMLEIAETSRKLKSDLLVKLREKHDELQELIHGVERLLQDTKSEKRFPATCMDDLCITEAQYDKAHVWMEAQDQKHEEQSTIGGRYTFEITPTSIGVAVVVVDQVLHEKLDLTNYDTW